MTELYRKEVQQLYSISFNEKTSKEINVEIVSRPAIPSAIRNITEQSIPGRNGSVYFDYKTYKDINISIDMNFKSKPDEWHEHLSNIKKWIVGTGELRLSDMQGYFYKVKKVELSKCERNSKEVGTITAIFTCDPFKYFDNGNEIINNPSIIKNDGIEAEPIYIISGQGMCTLSVNDITIMANVEDNLTIDTSVPIAYRNNGAISNISVQGEIDNLKLKEGDNYISITDGFNLNVRPMWRKL